MMFFLIIHTGEALEFAVQVLNDSAQSLVPILCLREKQTFAAQSKRMVHTNDILFESADCVPPWSSQTITKALRIPAELPPTFFNCCMMKLEYRLKVNFVDSQHKSTSLLVIPTFRHISCSFQTDNVCTGHKFCPQNFIYS